jgi:hypothetical protein
MSRGRRLLWVLFITFTVAFMITTIVLLVQGAFWSAVFSAFMALFLSEKSHEVLDPTRNKRIEKNKRIEEE